MFAISLWQPWASLIADKRKPHETRGFAPPPRLMGVDIAIHAAKRLQLEEQLLAKGWGYTPSELPLGAIVAVVRLSSCMRTELFSQPPFDLEYGDFSPGRWAWRLENVRKLRKPVVMAGKQGFFPIPFHYQREIDEQLAPRPRKPDELRPGDRLSQAELRDLMRVQK